jgi:hypothetical protein
VVVASVVMATTKDPSTVVTTTKHPVPATAEDPAEQTVAVMVVIVVMSATAHHASQPKCSNTAECQLEHRSTAATAATTQELPEEVGLLLLHIAGVAGESRWILQSVIDAVAVNIWKRDALLLRLSDQLLPQLHPCLGRHLCKRLLGQRLVILGGQLSRHVAILRGELGVRNAPRVPAKLLDELGEVVHESLHQGVVPPG